MSLSPAQQVASLSVDNIEQLLVEMLTGDYANNEISLGVLLEGKNEIQVQLKITRDPTEFIETDYNDYDASFKPIDSSTYIVED